AQTVAGPEPAQDAEARPAGEGAEGPGDRGDPRHRGAGLRGVGGLRPVLPRPQDGAEDAGPDGGHSRWRPARYTGGRKPGPDDGGRFQRAVRLWPRTRLRAARTRGRWPPSPARDDRNRTIGD